MDGRQALAAALDDAATGSHRAHTQGTAVSWTVDGRFVRSFRAGGAVSAAIVEHVAFTRFTGSEGPVVSLCVFGADTLVIHYYTGESFSVALPFGVERACALQQGLLVQRRAAEPAFAGSLPTLFSLLGPRSEFKMLGLGRAPDMDRMGRQRQLLLSPTPARTDGAIPVFNDPNIVLLGTAASRRSSSQAQFVLCWDTGARRHHVYQCTVVDQPPDTECTADSDASLSQLSNISQLSASRPRMARQASLSVQRRSSAVPSIGAASRRKSGFASAVKNDRRSSMLGRISLNDSPAPNYAADIFREQRQMRAEVVLQLCWSERRSREEPCADACICVVQSAAGADVVCVLTGGVLVALDAAFEEAMRCPAVSMAPVRATRPGLDDLLLVSPTGDLLLTLGGIAKPLSLLHRLTGNVARIVYTENDQAAIELVGHPDPVLVSTHVRISRIARALVDSLSFVLSRSAFLLLWRSAVSSILHAANADDEMDRLSSLLLHGSDQREPAASLPARVKAELRDRAPAVLFAFRLVYEDSALYKFEPAKRVAAVGQLLLRFALQTGQTRAHHALLRSGLVSATNMGLIETPAATRQRSADREPAIVPSLAKWALSVLDADSQPQPFPTLEHMGNLFEITDTEPVSGGRDSTKLLNVIANVLYQLALGRDAALVLRQLANDKAPMQLLRQLSVDMQWLVCSVIEDMQQRSISSWPASILRLLGRYDMLANTNEQSDCIAVVPSSCRAAAKPVDSGDGEDDALAGPKGIVELCDQVIEPHAGQSHVWNQSQRSREFSALAFSRDLRLDEAERLLHMSAPTHTTTSLDSAEAADGADGPKSQYLGLLARRVLALPLSQSLLRYSAQQLNPQDALPIQHPAVAAHFGGSKAASAWTADASDMSWPLFHSGVAAALSVERDQLRRAHPSWVLLNWPVEPADTAQDNPDAMKEFNTALAAHAGFLLGVGLLTRDPELSNSNDDRRQQQQRNSSGPLCNMPPWQAFKYLSKRHGLTSIALLLGCACAHRGTMSSSVSKILSLHIPTLLPPGSSELMLLSYGTQAAAMLGLGLLFMRSQNRRMVEVMLHELESIKWDARDTSARLDGADPAESTSECYSLASGFALGLTVLGCGQSTRTLADLRLLDTLSEFISGQRAGPPGPHVNSQTGSSHDATLEMLGGLSISARSESVSDIGAIAAIGLVFLGTNYAPAAQRLALPKSPAQLREADPFLMLWKSLMQSLIMLDAVQSTPAWVESTIPRACASSERGTQFPDLFRIRLHIIAASCMAIALKHAGTEDPRAHSTVLSYFDEIEQVASKPSLGYESSLTRSAAQSCLDVMCVATALVMAGSGDIPTMARLRALHGVSASRSYGNHMASHMALGILFLGGGARFTLSHSLESIALLLIAFFPRFPQQYSDNREHLQAWRHLWALCVVPRCLVVRDVSTGRMCRDAEVLLVEHAPDGGERVTRVVSPVPFPDMANVRTVCVSAPGFMPLRLDVMSGSYTRRLVCKRRVLYMQPLDDTPKRGLATLTEYMQWLATTKAGVDSMCEQLVQSDDPAPSTPVDCASVIRAVEQLRICARAARALATARKSSDSHAGGCWAESTFLAWLDIRQRVLLLGRRDECRRVLVRYWTGSQLPDIASSDSAVFYAVISLLYSVLDLPAPTDAMTIAKQVPVTQLVDYVLE
ncbi:Anaphase-promoting complex subunit 1 [Coemansia sp. RSA 2610]|nr:Anaphase-promoting complex subunit 1 [Coemansia sp. RSA 2610]